MLVTGSFLLSDTAQVVESSVFDNKRQHSAVSGGAKSGSSLGWIGLTPLES